VQEIAAEYALAATAWDLEYFGPPEASLALIPNSRASLYLYWDRYAGFDGCNWFLGVYNANDAGELRMMAPAETVNICEPPELYSQAGTYSSALINVTDYVLEGEQLIAYTVDDQRLLTFNPAKPFPMPGTEWALKFWWEPDREMWNPVIPESTTNIVFGEDGTASGTGGCNDYTVVYEGDLQIEKVMEATDTYAELPALTFGPITSQMAACSEPEDIMDQEQGYFVTLGLTAYYFKLGGMLMLLDADGMPLLVFAAQE
jgi:heat shock protein HslJ